MTYRYRSPRLLRAEDDLDGFVCRSDEQTQWLHRYSRQAHAAGTSRVLVVTAVDSDEVVAYYAWSMATIALTDAPDRLAKGAGRYRQPVALLARLGVAIDHEDRGLGAGSVGDVVARTVELSIEIGCRGLVVHAESAAARDFYLHLIPEFETSPTDDLHLVLLMKDIIRTLEG